MAVQEFSINELKNLKLPNSQGNKATNGQVTLIAGSQLFHGPALFALTILSALTDMVYFASPEPRFSDVANKLKQHIHNFIWVPLNEVDGYIAKSQATLIGPGLMRYRTENHQLNHISDSIADESRRLTTELLTRHPNHQWVIDAGSLQVLNINQIPPNSIITPNSKEFFMLFHRDLPTNQEEKVNLLSKLSQQFQIHIVAKNTHTLVASPDEKITNISTEHVGLTKGGGGDCLAALITGLTCQNDPHLSAASADFFLKQTSLRLSKIKGPLFTTDELANHVSLTIWDYLSSIK